MAPSQQNNMVVHLKLPSMNKSQHSQDMQYHAIVQESNSDTFMAHQLELSRPVGLNHKIYDSLYEPGIDAHLPR